MKKKRKTKKKAVDDMQVKTEMTWQIVKLPTGDYHWILMPRVK